MASQTIAIVGCGLIGGSISLALRKRRPHAQIWAFDLKNRLPSIRESGVASDLFSIEELPRMVKSSDLLILCTPVEVTLELISNLAPHLKPETLLIDMGSTKSIIMKTASENLPSGVHFIGGHPIAGSENSGAEAADALLFKDRVIVLCPQPETPAEALLASMDVVEDLLAVPLTLEADEHDRILAMVSHVPQLLAMALMHAAMETDQNHHLLDVMAGRNFLDQTRVSASDFSVWKSILNTNLPAIDQALTSVEKSLKQLRRAMDDQTIEVYWENVGRKRRHLKMDSFPRNRKPDLRELIDHCDEKILQALATRFQLAKKMGTLKSYQNLGVKDVDRERRMLKKRETWGAMLGLDSKMIQQIFSIILDQSRTAQENLTSKSGQQKS